MKDRYPEHIELEIERESLRNYLRVKWLSTWMLTLGVLGAMLGITSSAESLENMTYIESVTDFLLILARGIGSGLCIGMAAGMGLYLLFSHRLAAKTAESLRVTVEGVFLRVVRGGSTRVDRKLHFRSIVDYSTIEERLMRLYGVMALNMTTTGGAPQSSLQVIGLKDCPKVRDMLAEIDSIRENAVE